MDIRSIIDPEPSTSTPKREGVPSNLEDKQVTQDPLQSLQSSYHGPPPGHHPPRDNRPPQPPPLQAPAHTDFRSPSSSSYQSILSPYQPTPSSVYGSSQHPFPRNIPQSPSHGAPGGAQYTQRDGPMAPVSAGYPVYGHSTPISHTPTATTPGSAQTYFAQTRPQSSHSTSTPTSAQLYTSQFPHQSPSASQPPTRAASQTFVAQQYLSQPSTPLGPPPTFGRGTSGVRRESPGSHGHTRNLSGGSYSHPPMPNQSPASDHSGSYHASPMSYGARQPVTSHRDHSMGLDRERSESVSPKTRLPSQPRIDVSRATEQSVGSQRAQMPSTKTGPAYGRSEPYSERGSLASQGSSRSFSFGLDGILNGPIMNEISGQTKDLGQHSQKAAPQESLPRTGTLPSIEAPASSIASNLPAATAPSVGQSASQSSAPDVQSLQQTYPSHTDQASTILDHSHLASLPPHPSKQPSPPPITQAREDKVDLHTMSPKRRKSEQTPPAPEVVQHPAPPKSVKRRREDPPIWARSSRRGGRGNPFLAKSKNPTVKLGHGASEGSKPTGSPRSQNRPQPEANGDPVATSEAQVPPMHPDTNGKGPLGVWESNILNTVPYDEITRSLSDWLFKEVVHRSDVGVAPAGGGKVEGAVLEIEAKIGRLIDKNTEDRLHLPCLTECVVDKSPAHVRVVFKSSMTDAQHCQLNKFLNRTLIDSKNPPRIPMDYVHTYETDTFYELSQTGHLALPPSIREKIDPRNPRTIPKMRVTTDKKTGAEIGKIIKVRVGDLDVYSPRTPFDWRVSVNVEMSITGDAKDMIEPGSVGKKAADRNKDRLTYRHQAYQVDLTQVTGADALSKVEKEHELEIEVASGEVRRQGLLATDGKPSQYEDLIRGFVENVRILARHCKDTA